MLADDVTCFLKDPQSIDYILDCLERFRRYSGLKINPDKSHILPLGQSVALPTSVTSIKSCESLTILCIRVGHGGSERDHYEWNFETKLKKCMDICDNWNNRSLSLKGKVTVINSLLIPIMLYPASVTYTPERVIKEFRKLVCKFIWASEVNRIAYYTLCLPIEQGGLNLLDLKS